MVLLHLRDKECLFTQKNMKLKKELKNKICIELSKDLARRARVCAYYTPGLTLTKLIAQSLESEIRKLEISADKSFSRSTEVKLSAGRPFKDKIGPEITVRKLGLKEAEKEEYKYYSKLSAKERLDILQQMLATQGIHNGAIERSVRIYPLNE